jgi:hypothetical protein
MGRLPDIDEAKLSSEQRRIYDQIMAARGHVRGPLRGLATQCGALRKYA